MKAKNLKDLRKMLELNRYKIIADEDPKYFSFYHPDINIILYAEDKGLAGMSICTKHKPNHKTGTGWVVFRNIYPVTMKEIKESEKFALNRFLSNKEKKITVEEYLAPKSWEV